MGKFKNLKKKISDSLLDGRLAVNEFIFNKLIFPHTIDADEYYRQVELKKQRKLQKSRKK